MTDNPTPEAPEVLRQAAARIRDDCPIPMESRCWDFVDYPTGWAMQAIGGVEHDRGCSSVQTQGAMLCDCEAIYTTWRRWKSLLAVADWLDNAAEDLGMQAPGGDLSKQWDMRVHINGDKALAVARTYLATAAPTSQEVS